MLRPFSKLTVIYTSSMNWKDQQCKYESATKTDSSSRYEQEHFLKQSCTSLEHAKANESFAEEVSRRGSAILTASHQML